MSGRFPRGSILHGRSDARLRASLRIATVVIVSLGTILGVSLAVQGWLAPIDAVVVTHVASAGVVAAIVTLAAAVIDRRPVSALGFRPSWRWLGQLLAGMTLGLLLVAGMFLLSRALGTVAVVETPTPDPVRTLLGLGGFLVAFAAVGVWEETVFRGYFIVNAIEGLAARGLTPSWAVFGAWASSSLVFGFLHVGFSTVPTGAPFAGLLASWLLMGGLLGLSFLATGRLAFPIGLHWMFNFGANNVFFGLRGPLSSQVPSAFRVDVTAGPAWHPIGGIPLLLAIAVGYGVVLAWASRRNDGLVAGSILRRHAEPAG